MASIFRSLSITIIIALSVLLFSLPVSVNSAVSPRELEAMLSALRSHNYNLFSNAIVTSDILYDLNSNTSRSFTFFAPSDSSLFALDMTSTSSFYTQTLRYHIVPRRLSALDLRLLRSGSSLRTLLPRHNVHVSRRQPGSNVFTIEGVDVVIQGLYYGRDVAVHGLAGILSFRSQVGDSRRGLTPQVRPSVVNSSINGFDSPDSNKVIPPVNRTVLPPLPDLSPVNSTVVPKLPPVKETSLPPLPEVPSDSRSVKFTSPEPPTVNGLSSVHLTETALSPGHQSQSPIAEITSPPMNDVGADLDKNARSVRLEKKFLDITGDAAEFEVAGELTRAIKQELKSESEAGNPASLPVTSCPSDEEKTEESQMTDGEIALGHVSVLGGNIGSMQRYTVRDL